jgi:Helicase conserved C-terminal domain
MLRDYQYRGVELMVTVARSDFQHSTNLASPTGTGKTYVLLEAHLRIRGLGFEHVLITPSDDVINGFIEKVGINPDELSDKQFDQFCYNWRIFTPIKFRNMLMRGDIDFLTHMVTFDEGHHSIANSYTDILALCGAKKTALLTATPYRATAAQTAKLYAKFGKPIWLKTYKDAFREQLIKRPEIIIKPLVDDDCIEVVNGEFVVTSADAFITNRLEAIASLIASKQLGEASEFISFPSRHLADTFLEYCGRYNIPAERLKQETTKAQRRDMIARCENREILIVDCNVLREGVDTKINRWWDADVTNSPVEWMQKLGRIMRFDQVGKPQYVGLCRNFFRHGYILGDCYPPAIFSTEGEVFGTFSSRTGSRVIGMEGLGRFKKERLTLINGSFVDMYMIETPTENGSKLHACMYTPDMAYPKWFKRVDKKNTEGRDYGNWEPCSQPDISEGYASIPKGTLTEAQKKVWDRLAPKHGLNPQQEVNKRNLQALFICLNNKWVL